MSEAIILNNGVKIPKIGYGVYQVPARVTTKCVSEAVEVGYRLIDTAQCYGNEAEVGAAVRAADIDRSEFFVTTKLWGGQGYEDTLQSIEKSLQRLDLDYIDLLLIHEPSGDFLEIYRAMEDCYEKGKLKAIGVANFLGDNFKRLVENVRIMPQINQLETHVFRQQREMQKVMQEYNIQLQSWSPLACGQNNFFFNPVLAAIAEKHHKSVAQIGLRFLYQQDIIIIPKSVHKERMSENRDITNFVLDEEDMAQIRALDKGRSLFNWW